jgi:hypothetical protein
MLNGHPNSTLTAVVEIETMKALRAGVPVETVIATLVAQVDALQNSAPFINAVLDSKRSPV